MSNWKQELYAAINAIDDLSSNPATLTLNVATDATDEAYLAGTDSRTAITRSVTVKAPQEVAQRMIDGMRYFAGDFLCRIDYVQLQSVLQSRSTDPALVIGGETVTLQTARPITAARNFGIDLADDTLTIGGETWSIAGISADKWLDGEPALLVFTLRKRG